MLHRASSSGRSNSLYGFSSVQLPSAQVAFAIGCVEWRSYSAELASCGLEMTAGFLPKSPSHAEPYKYFWFVVYFDCIDLLQVSFERRGGSSSVCWFAKEKVNFMEDWGRGCCRKETGKEIIRNAGMSGTL